MSKIHLTGDPLHSRALAHSRAALLTQPCPHCSHSRAPGEQWARLCVFTLQGCVQAARLCRGSPVHLEIYDLEQINYRHDITSYSFLHTFSKWSARWYEYILATSSGHDCAKSPWNKKDHHNYHDYERTRCTNCNVLEIIHFHFYWINNR